MEAGHHLAGIEPGAPGEGQGQAGEQHAKVPASMRARHRAPAGKPQGADPQIEQRDDDGGRQRGEQREVLAGLGPGHLADVVAEVLAEHGVSDPEVRGGGRQGRQPPPVPGAPPPGERDPEEQSAAQRHGEQYALRHGFDDLEIAEAAGHLHRADRAVDEVNVNRAPGDGEQQDGESHHPREGPGIEVGVARRHARRPGPLGGLERQPAAADQHDHQNRGGGQQAPAAPRLGHARTPFAASQPSTSAR